MEWDLGLTGVAVLLALSLGFGLLAQIFAGRGVTRWMWFIGGGTFFIIGLLISETWFGSATVEDLQPNYDGLSFDETLLAIFPSIAVVVIARRVIRHRHLSGASGSRTPPVAHPM
jgi:hypothetical protein